MFSLQRHREDPLNDAMGSNRFVRGHVCRHWVSFQSWQVMCVYSVSLLKFFHCSCAVVVFMVGRTEIKIVLFLSLFFDF